MRECRDKVCQINVFGKRYIMLPTAQIPRRQHQFVDGLFKIKSNTMQGSKTTAARPNCTFV